MKLVKTANGHKIKMSRSDWESYGRKAGWLKKAQQTRDNSLDGPLMSELAQLRTRLAGLKGEYLDSVVSGSVTNAHFLKNMIDGIRNKYNRSHRINDTAIAHLGAWLNDYLEGNINKDLAISQFGAQAQNALSSIDETMEWLSAQERNNVGLSQKPTTNQWN
jgi:hypothetical protein